VKDIDIDIDIVRLQPSQAESVLACFRKVYGDSYANETFYDVDALRFAMTEERIRCVGAISGGSVIAHMAMTVHDTSAVYPELGNTVVSPAARGEGLAWRVGSALTDWCLELGFTGYLHYPTTAHPIMQQQSVKAGFETGLMLGYIPGETDGQVYGSPPQLREAATVVFEPLSDKQKELAVYLPQKHAADISAFAEQCGLPRIWLEGGSVTVAEESSMALHRFRKRGLTRLQVKVAGSDFRSNLLDLVDEPAPCLQLDLNMDDPAINLAVDLAVEFGFVFSAWLPGVNESDVFRLQRVDSSQTVMLPGVVNPVATSLLTAITEQL